MRRDWLKRREEGKTQGARRHGTFAKGSERKVEIKGGGGQFFSQKPLWCGHIELAVNGGLNCEGWGVESPYQDDGM